MQNQSPSNHTVTHLRDYERPRAGFNRQTVKPAHVEPVLSLLPDMSNTNGRGVVEMVAQVLRQQR